MAGGVAANSRLREMLRQRCENTARTIPSVADPLHGQRGHDRVRRLLQIQGGGSGRIWTLDAIPNLPL